MAAVIRQGWVGAGPDELTEGALGFIVGGASICQCKRGRASCTAGQECVCDATGDPWCKERLSGDLSRRDPGPGLGRVL